MTKASSLFQNFQKFGVMVVMVVEFLKFSIVTLAMQDSSLGLTLCKPWHVCHWFGAF